MLDEFVAHSSIAAFASERVKLKYDDVRVFREQMGRFCESITTYISKHPRLDLVRTLHFGSLANDTALATLSASDVAIYVKRGRAPEDKLNLLEWMSDRLREALQGVLDPEQILSGDNHVTIDYRGSGLNVNILPVLFDGGEDYSGYLISPATGEKVQTCIESHLEFNRWCDSKHKTHYRQVVCLLKWWSRYQKAKREGFKLHSFMTELLLAKLANSGLALDNYVQAMFDFFTYIVRTGLRDEIRFEDRVVGCAISDGDQPVKIIDPANSENNVAGCYSYNDRDVLVEAAQDAQDAIAMSRRATTKGDALDGWQQVLGTGFKVA